MLNVDRSTVNYALQNTQNDCYQWLSDSQIRFRTPLGELTALPQNPLPGSRDPTSKGRGGNGKERDREGERSEGSRNTPINSCVRPSPSGMLRGYLDYLNMSRWSVMSTTRP